ncbi:hypothetical protein HOV23_gp045 [Pseudomonas phage Lana]|uniref:Uncharacterized protein n=1 Tax=Pseudomonas phage Lana TaxID=2530172 RepID=A0A481W7B1_9CAUD|nr:hypothetical protein HOV23_gp045 [Pseudomonas phage Lana]QBJ04528.1 hypothetical protein [Pseudomonas phage Lana]
MNIVFAAPAATGKTHFKEALKAHFKCQQAYDDGEINGIRWPSNNGPHDTLILCCNDRSDQPGRRLSREEMNAAMVAVGGIPIWNDDGSVNMNGKRAVLVKTKGAKK